MVSVSDPQAPARPGTRRALILSAVLLAVELAVIGVIFKHGIDFNCRANWSNATCGGASSTLVSVYCAMGALILFAMVRPRALATLTHQAGDRLWPLGLNLAGALVALIPVSFMQNGASAATILPAFGFWTLGMGALLGGLMLYLAPLPRWRAFLTAEWSSLLPVVVAGIIAPALATLMRPLWSLDAIADATFKAVTWIIGKLGYVVESWVEGKVIGADEFYIAIDKVCSGIEGIALVTLFVTLYLALFRSELRFPRAFLLYPIGIAASALFNVFRITILLVIGLEGQPELAVGGFHSHAGWLMFTLVALGVIGLAKTLPALQKDPETMKIETISAENSQNTILFWHDPAVARIFPFAIFMLSALAVSVLSQTPGVLYPLRAVALAAAVLAFWPLYARLPWRLDPLALGAGLAIGLMWVLIPVEEASEPPYGALTGVWLAGWMLARGIGTILLVPLVEELFFRDYLEGLVRRGTGWLWSGLAALVSATAFAALHDRWMEAFVAGLVFSALARRSGRITDAILAHAAANALVFALAAMSGKLHII